MKTILSFLALLALVFLAVTEVPSALAAASDTGAVVTATGDATAPWLSNLVTNYPWISTVLIVIGAFRVVAKPLMSLAHALAAYTPTSKDDAIVDKVEASWAWRAFCWVLDWSTSLKVGTQRPTVATSAPATNTPANTGT